MAAKFEIKIRIYNENHVSRHGPHTIHLDVHVGSPSEMYFGAFYEASITDFHTKCWSRNRINQNKDTIP